MNEEVVGYPYNGILLSNEKEWSVDKLRDVDESQYNMLNEKNPDKKRVLIYLYDIFLKTTLSLNIPAVF